LSLTIINMLMPLYGNDVTEVAQRIAAFFKAHEEELVHVYEEADDWRVSAFLYQPEALMLLDRLETDDLEMRRLWNEHFPEKELERVANAFGMSFD